MPERESAKLSLPVLYPTVQVKSSSQVSGFSDFPHGGSRRWEIGRKCPQSCEAPLGGESCWCSGKSEPEVGTSEVVLSRSKATKDRNCLEAQVQLLDTQLLWMELVQKLFPSGCSVIWGSSLPLAPLASRIRPTFPCPVPFLGKIFKSLMIKEVIFLKKS